MSQERAEKLSAEIWRQCERVFEQAVALPEAERKAWLDEACAGQPEVRRHVEALLRADGGAHGILTLGSSDEAGGSRAPETPRFRPGALLAERFELRRFLAAGGMGEVYEAFDREVREPVAVKVLFDHLLHRERQIERFRREVQLARRVTHANACRTFDLFRHRSERGGVVFLLSMELLRGESLADRLRRCGRIEPEQARGLLEELAAGLEAVHAAGVVHRDLKANNVMLVDRGDGDVERLVITDFGIARPQLDADTGDDAGAGLTSSHLILGTPAYLAPEQILGHPVSPATDVYAMGVLAYEMLTGELPFRGRTPMETAYERLQRPASDPSRKLPGLDPCWDRLIRGALAREPADRFQTPTSALAVLDGERPAAAGPPTAASKPLRAASAAALGLLVLVLAVWMLWPSRSPTVEVEAAAPAAVRSAERPLRLAILGFDQASQPAGSEHLAAVVRDLLGRELALGEDISLVPPALVARTLAGRQPESVGRLEPPDRDAIMELLNADYLVAGAVTAVGSQLRFDIELGAGSGRARVSPLVETGEEAEIFEIVSRAASRLRAAVGGAELDLESSLSARRLRPDSAEVARLHAAALERLHRHDPLGAVESLERAVELDGDSPVLLSTLADAWADMGYGNRAAEAASRALAAADDLPRHLRLRLEARSSELASSWDEACRIRVTLATFYEHDLEAGMRLVDCLRQGSRSAEARQALEALLARLPAELADDLRLDLLAARVAAAEGDSESQLDAARRAAEKAGRLGEPLAEAEALLEMASAEYVRGALQATLDWLDRAEPAFRQAGHALRLAKVYNLRGSVAGDRGQSADVPAYYEQARAAYASAGHRRGIGIVDLNHGIHLLQSSDLDGAERLLRAAKQSFEQVEELGLLARAAGTFGYLEWLKGDFAASLRHHEQALGLSRQTGDRHGEAMALQNVATILEAKGDFDQAAAVYGEAAELYRQLGIESNWHMANANLAGLELQRGNAARAARLLTSSLAHNRLQEHYFSIAWQGRTLAEIYWLQAKPAEARKIAREALEAARRIDSVPSAGNAQRVLLELRAAGGEAETARSDLESLATSLGEGDFNREAARVAVALVQLEAKYGEPAKALEWSDAAGDLLVPGQNLLLEVLSLALRAGVLRHLGRIEQAERAAAEARRLAESVDRPLVTWTIAPHLALVEAAAGRGERALADLRRVAEETRSRGLHLLALECEITAAQLRLRSGRRGAQGELAAACQEAGSRQVAGHFPAACPGQRQPPAAE